jgi:beta-aspartyl-peptidase (threonine type)
MSLGGEAPGAAARRVLEEIRALGGLGGVIVLDGAGRYSLSFSTEGMYRGRADAKGREVAIFAGEQP